MGGSWAVPPPPIGPMLREASPSPFQTTGMSSNEEMVDIDVITLDSPGPQHLMESLTDSLSSREKMYFCQRCLNHGQSHPRKGHKPYCKYAACNCNNCSMVETRRQLNNKLKSPKGGRVQKKTTGAKERSPNCARCSAHGIVTALRGHKKTMCPFFECECEKCKLVCHRRDIMARQIKLRRNQQRARLLGEGRRSIDSTGDSSSESGESPSPSPPLPLIQPMPMRPLPMPIMPRLPPMYTPNPMLVHALQQLTTLFQTNPMTMEAYFALVHNYHRN